MRVTLTDPGRQSALDFHAEVTTELNRLLESLGSKEREQFCAAMTAITQSAGVTGRWATNRTD